MYIFELQRRCVVRPRISFEETTPLHKQRNCGGVRASVASALHRENGRESERVAFITIVTKRLHPPGESHERGNFPATLCTYASASLSLSFYPNPNTSARTRSRMCVCCMYTTIYDFLEGREYENTYIPCIVRARVLRIVRSD